jgi:hypothetical protein
VHSRGRLGLLLARRSQTVGSGPGVTGGMMSDQQSLSLGERGPGIVGPLPPEVTRDCVGVVVRLMWPVVAREADRRIATPQ